MAKSMFNELPSSINEVKYLFNLDKTNIKNTCYENDNYIIRFVNIYEDDTCKVVILQKTMSQGNEFDHISFQEIMDKVSPNSEVVKHIAYKRVLSRIKKSYVPYLFGEAGTGKNIICEQIADELGLKFFTQNSVQFKHDLIGYGDAKGDYVETPFYQAFTNGGLFFLDELDVSDPSAVKSLNQAIGSRYYSFPVVGLVQAHEDFRCICAGNTIGKGESGDYVGNVIDASTLNRFSFIRVDYDERIEMKITNNNKELVDFFHEIRKSSKEANYNIVASYRGLKGITDFEKEESISNLLDEFLMQGAGKDEINSLIGCMDVDFVKSNKYAKALKQLAKSL